MRQTLEKLWRDWRGQIFLANLANQFANGTLDPKKVRGFFVAAKSRPEDFVSRNRLFDSGFTPSDICFVNRMRPGAQPDRLFLRVAPMAMILDAVSFSGVDGAGDNEKAQERLHALAGTPVGQEAKADREENLLKYFLRGGAKNGDWFSSSNLPPILDKFPLRLGTLGLSGIKLSAESADPVFVAPLELSGTALAGLSAASNSARPADYLRDLLGLDFLAHAWRGRRTVVGFILFRERQWQGTRIARPSPFDKTSEARFRAAFGDNRAALGSCGRTADLAKIGSAETIEGAAEVVLENKGLRAGDRSVIVGYLGQVADPRGDADTGSASANGRDLTFLQHIMGAHGKDEILTIILDNAP